MTLGVKLEGCTARLGRIEKEERGGCDAAKQSSTQSSTEQTYLFARELAHIEAVVSARGCSCCLFLLVVLGCRLFLSLWKEKVKEKSVKQTHIRYRSFIGFGFGSLPPTFCLSLFSVSHCVSPRRSAAYNVSSGVVRSYSPALSFHSIPYHRAAEDTYHGCRVSPLPSATEATGTERQPAATNRGRGTGGKQRKGDRETERDRERKKERRKNGKRAARREMRGRCQGLLSNNAKDVGPPRP